MPCYDDQNRLVWASSAAGAIPCGGTNPAGSLTSAQYTQTFSYDALSRLTSGPLGPYTYGTGMQTSPQTPLDAAQSIGTPGQNAPPYSALYNSNGEMTCRSTSTTPAASCWNGNTGGAQLSYDAEGQLVHWQNAPGSTSAHATDALSAVRTWEGACGLASSSPRHFRLPVAVGE